jgi:hypothetical protein
MFNRTLLILSFICLISCTKEIIQQKLTVSVTPTNGGTVSPPSNSYEKGSNVSLVATPTGEYLFKQWQGSISGTSNPTSITMDADKSVTGVFEKRQYPLTLTIEGSGTVKEEVIAIATQALYPSGTTVRLTAQPADKFEFGGWSGDLTSTANPLDLKIEKAISLKALFQQIKFPGYKVDPNAKKLGRDYWKNTGVMSDFYTAFYQKPLGTRTKYATYLVTMMCGDFNNDGWIDIFNPGASYQGPQANFAFLIWNPKTYVFEEKNLFNDKSFSSFGGNKNKTIPIYLNDDNFLDLIIVDNGDEGIQGSPDEPIRIVLSDGKGGYDLKAISTSENESPVWKKEAADVGDLNGDGFVDLFITENMFTYIYWGVKDFPYFTKVKRARFVGDFTNFGETSDNGFGDKPKYLAGNVYTATIKDFNKDGKNDIILGVGEDKVGNPVQRQSKIMINTGGGRFTDESVMVMPFYSTDSQSFLNQDYEMDDLNGDGLNDLIAVNTPDYRTWNIFAYIQQKDGTFIIDKSMFQYTINSVRKGFWKPRLIYFDFNGDGLKDVSYLDDADNGELKYKSVFIRTGNKFVETDFYQFDAFAKSLLPLLK